MAARSAIPARVRWSQVRFAVVGPLLVQPQPRGVLQANLQALAEQSWPHPITGKLVRFSSATIERWYYKAVAHEQPTESLLRSQRRDAGQTRRMDTVVKDWLRQSYADHPAWSYLLHFENLLASRAPNDRAQIPSYSTVRRYMRRAGWRPRRCVADRLQTAGAVHARNRFRSREVQSFEHTHTHALWHIDGHHGSLALTHAGIKQRPVLIAIIDDHSRLICHGQWFWREDAAAAAHVLIQAITKRGLPRMLLSDNGGAYTAAEITQGLHRLSILSEQILCYSPYQNGKMENFWGTMEGRLMAMLDHQPDLNLYRLNTLTQAWIEHEYHRRQHASIRDTPLGRYQTSPHVGRTAPSGHEMTYAFTQRVSRQQRLSDGSISVAGKRFTIPSRLRHLDQVIVRYASWDMDTVFLANPDTDAIIERLYPVDLAAHASGDRAQVDPTHGPPVLATMAATVTSRPLPPLLQEAVDHTQRSGLPPAFVPFTSIPQPEMRREAAR